MWKKKLTQARLKIFCKKYAYKSYIFNIYV